MDPNPAPDGDAPPTSFLTTPRALWAALVPLVALAWVRRFVVDDAFISFRYARHLVEGHGLVWNPGEAVEGYTNFLWTLLMALPHLWGARDPVPFAYAVGLVSFAVTLVATWRLGRTLLLRTELALLATVLLGVCPSASSWATGGLETSLQTGLLVTAAALTGGAWSRETMTTRRAMGVSLLLGAAFMTRMDSAILGSAVGLAAIWVILARPGSDRVRLLAALCLPFLAVVGSWLTWKVTMYGGILPNTWHAKVGAAVPWDRGLAYLGTFASSYLLLPLALIPLAVWRGDRERRAPFLVLLGALGAWCLYVARVGGDFMEFRFMVPALPYLYLLLIWATWGLLRAPWARALVVVALVGGSWHHHARFAFRGQIEPVSMLHAHLDTPAQDWRGVGETLRGAFEGARDVKIATTAAGVIPYLAQVRALDMIGLTDPWVASHGRPYGKQWGHDRIAPMSYLVAQRVHLVLGQPWIRAEPAPPGATHYRFRDLRGLQVLDGERADALPPTASILEIPLDASRRLVALYLYPHPAIEAARRRLGWRRFGIQAPGPDATL